MAERRWTMQRGTVGVWQRLAYGPRPGRAVRAQARRAKAGSGRPLSAGLVSASLLLAGVARWANV
jgi:hypothetical protein